jgi:hypothetical protein
LTSFLRSDKDVAATVWDRERSGRLSQVIKGTRKKLHVVEEKHMNGGRDRTRTCDLLRVKQAL